MFKARKHLEYALGKCARMQETDKLLRDVCRINQETLNNLIDRIDDLMKANGKLKRDLDIESRQKEELSELLSEAERDAHCPADCKNIKNQDVCRMCKRHPAATDRYEVRK